LARQRIPFLFVTGYSREALPASFRHATMLAKPFESQQLVEAVSALARRGESAVQLNR